MPQNKKYRLSALAKQDLMDIFDFTIAHWGEQQAMHYAQILSAGFDLLAENPETGQIRDDLLKHARSFPVGSHIVFYSIQPQTPNGIEIARVLHQSMDYQNIV